MRELVAAGLNVETVEPRYHRTATSARAEEAAAEAARTWVREGVPESAGTVPNRKTFWAWRTFFEELDPTLGQATHCEIKRLICWRCDAAPAASEVGLCDRCREDLR
ncbi:MAG TPA: hypothetical protein VFV36_10290 [Candidatus Methylomirabilis sp.]|nr:hypothetical protein [Candidatus Methylomirabilis sp.]